MKATKPAYLTLLLTVIHGVAGLSILVISSWFIAISAIAPVGFNYVIPAVVIRALALLRIASGYASMWVGHNDLLNRIAIKRLQVFEQFKNSQINDKAMTTEALTEYTQDIASKWIAWIAPLSSVTFIFTLVCIAALWMALPGAGYLCILFVVWLMVLTTQALNALKTANLHTKATKDFRQQSAEFFNTSAIWHLQKHIVGDKKVTRNMVAPIQARGMVTAHNVWQHQLTQKKHALRASWYFQGMAFLVVILVMFAKAPLLYAFAFAPIAIVVPMVILAAPDWASSAFHSVAKFAQYTQSEKMLNALDVTAIKQIRDFHVQHSLNLTNFSVLSRGVGPLTTALPAAGIVTIGGASGCGKSSLLQGIAGLLPTQGNRTVDGLNVPPGLISNWLYVEQLPIVLSGSVQQNLDPAGHGLTPQEMAALLSQLGLEELIGLSAWVGKAGRPLSGGEQKRLALARAILAKPSVLLVDEPFEGLDAITQNRVCNLLNQIATQCLVIVASHVAPSALKVQKQIVLGEKPTRLMNRGQRAT
ncbi:cysteine/glutathione ABC transporter ATP-binding protein/permease CydC [Alteromonas sp. D210916BOD_24]|uniref:ATP-binding cassette domain-containing protein n=1 Tax=Alteromonas sp. D210916BOD_24 TaxID=3157618 RepID=UPI00399CDAE1